MTEAWLREVGGHPRRCRHRRWRGGILLPGSGERQSLLGASAADRRWTPQCRRCLGSARRRPIFSPGRPAGWEQDKFVGSLPPAGGRRSTRRGRISVIFGRGRCGGAWPASAGSMQRQWQPGAETCGRPGHRRGRRPVADSRLSLQHGAATWRRGRPPRPAACLRHCMRRVHGGAGRRRWAVPRAAAVGQEARRRLAAELAPPRRSGGARLLLPALQAHAGVGGRAPSLPCQLMETTGCAGAEPPCRLGCKPCW